MGMDSVMWCTNIAIQSANVITAAMRAIVRSRTIASMITIRYNTKSPDIIILFSPSIG